MAWGDVLVVKRVCKASLRNWIWVPHHPSKSQAEWHVPAILVLEESAGSLDLLASQPSCSSGLQVVRDSLKT